MTIKVNLLPTERKRFTFDPLLGFLVLIVIVCSVGCVVYGSGLQKDINQAKNDVVKVENDIKSIEQSLPVIDNLKTQIAKLKDEIKVIESLVYDPVRYGNLLAEVGRVLPDNVWVNSLAVEPSTTSITIGGVAAYTEGRPPLATIANLMARMGESPIFADLSLSSTSQTSMDNGGLGFGFQIEAKYDADAAAGLSGGAGATQQKADQSAGTES